MADKGATTANDALRAERLVRVLSALAEPTRLETMRLLIRQGELCACELTPSLNATQSRMSRHLQTLKQAGLVTDRRDAQRVLYRVNPALPPDIGNVLDAVMAAREGTARRVA